MKILRGFALIFLAATFAFPSYAATKLQDGLLRTYPAPEISGIEKWLNSNPLKISELKGKIVLIDFWAYSCINCLRTLPHINYLQEKYADKGLVIIGIHAPEFDFEKNPQNVAMALKKFGIKYAVALDNKLQTWSNFDNHYWPAHYLIDQEGKVVYTHFGEGKYEVMENNIQALLALKKVASIQNFERSNLNRTHITSETYLGKNRGANNFNESLKNLTFPKALPSDGWALQGDWEINPQFVESKKNGDSLKLNFTAKKVFLVMSSVSGKAVNAEIFLDGKKITSAKDVAAGVVTVEESRLYELLSLERVRSGLLEIKAGGSGLQAYAFTFGD